MLGMMTGNRLAVDNPDAAALEAMLSGGVKGRPDIHAIASADDRSITVLVSNYHDSGKAGPEAAVRLTIAGVPAGRHLLEHFRVDQQHSNSYEAWKKMGSPQQPTPEQYAGLEQAGQLQNLESPRWIEAQDGRVLVEFSLPRHGVSLLRIAR
jgi:xylan 1,4-beta-xylosidase